MLLFQHVIANEVQFHLFFWFYLPYFLFQNCIKHDAQYVRSWQVKYAEKIKQSQRTFKQYAHTTVPPT